MADRRERVILDAEISGFNTKMAQAAVAARGLEGALDDLDGTQVKAKDSTDGLGRSTEGLGKSQRETTKSTKAYTLEMALVDERAARLRKSLREQARAQLDVAAGIDETTEVARTAGPEIDRYSGRLRLAVDAVLTLGTAAVPLGAAAAGGVAALAAQFAALAGGIGVTVLAMQGLGDAMKAVDKAQLEPTAANLQAARIELEKLGPAGAAFVQYLQQISPQLSEIQMAARAGLFPGMEDGIDALLERAPQVTRIVTELSTAMGDLFRDSGEGLASERFDAFFSYLETDAAPTLRSLAEAMGNVTEGVANMIVGFAPVTDDFSAGLVNMTEDFAQWSQTLADSDGFQSFVGYIRESGPQVIDLLGSMVGAVAGIVEAAAPVGSAVVPILTVMADALGALARSDAGPVLFSLAAGLIAVNRATAGISSLSGTLSGAFSGVEAGATKSERALSALNRAGLALGGLAAAGALMDLLGQAALDAAPNVERLTAALIDQDAAAFAKEFGDVGAALASLDPSGVDGVVRSFDELTEKGGLIGEALGGGLAMFAGAQGDLVRVSQAADQASVDFGSLDKSLANLVASAGPEKAMRMFNELVASEALTSEETAQLRAQLPDFNNALLAQENAAKLAADSTRQLGSALRYGADGAQSFSTALSELNGWLDKRAAIRAYEASLKDLGKGLKNGFGPADIENLDATARGIAQVAAQIKSPELRADFLANARRSLATMAKGAGPEARAEIERVIGKLDELGLTHPKPKVRLDAGAAEAQAARVRRDLQELNGQRANPKADLDDGAFTGKLRRSKEDLSFFDRMRAVAEMDGDASGAQSAAQAARAAGQSVDGDVFKIYIDTVRRFFGESAEGNFFPAVKAFAGGGLDRANAHQPELYRGPTTRVWGEPETQGEAYIPLANDHRRPRARNILEITAGELGGEVRWFAQGGLQPADTYARSDPRARMTADLNTSLGYAARAVLAFGSTVAGSERGMKGELKVRQRLLEKALEREEKEQQARKEHLDALRQESQALKETAANRLRSDLFAQRDRVTLDRPEGFDQWSIAQQQDYLMLEQSLNRPADPFDTLRADREKAREEARDVERLKALGLGEEALAYLIDNGQVGNLDGYSAEQVRRFDRLFNQREKAIDESASSQAAAVFGREIRGAREDYREQTEVVRDLRQDVKRVERAIERHDKSNREGQRENAKDVKDGVNGAAGNGQRRRK